MAREQENAAAQGDKAFIVEKFPSLLAEYEILLENIGQFLEQHRQEKNEKEKLPGLPVRKLREETAAALEELKHFRSRECAERVEKILLHELEEDTKERLLQIREQLKLYEDDNAEELLGQLIDMLEKEENEHK